MSQQLIVSGFHRSGTSLTAQLLHHAGVFLGYKILPQQRSNPHGHFEDWEILRFHDKILEDSGLTWQFDGSCLPVVEEAHRLRLMEMIERRDAEQEVWGFKDPRVCLFMETWKELLPDARVLIVYRDFAESTHSLYRRAANGILYGTWKQHYHRRIWEEPDLPLKMWIAHNRLLVDFAHTYPEDVLVVSFNMLRNEFPLVDVLKQHWGLTLDDVPTQRVFDSSVTAEKPGKQIVADENLIGETLEIWEALGELSRRTEEQTGISSANGERMTEEAFHKPTEAYVRTMEREFLGFERQYLLNRLEETESSRSQAEQRLSEAEQDQKRLRTQLSKSRQNSLSPERKKELEEAEKNLRLVVNRMSRSTLAPLFRLKREFRELEAKYGE